MPRIWWTVYTLGRETVRLFIRAKCTRLGAALAFYVVLSLAPLILVLTGLVGIIFGSDKARHQLHAQVNELIGREGAQVVDTLLTHNNPTTGGIISTIVGLGALIIGATSLFSQMQEALNTVWEMPEQESKGRWYISFLRDRLLSFSVVAGLAFLLLVSLVANAVLSGLQEWLRSHMGEGVNGLKLMNMAFSMLLAIALFALIFRVLPYRHASWRSVLVGSVCTALLFTIGKYLIGLYLGTAAVGSAYGAAGSLVVVLVWVYYSTQILLFGAAFTRVYSELREELRTAPQHQQLTTEQSLAPTTAIPG